MDDRDWEGPERRSSNVEIRELVELERRIGKNLREIEGSVSEINRESTRLSNIAQKYNDLRATQNTTMELVQQNRDDLSRLCNRENWWLDIRNGLVWAFGLTATILLILERLGFITG